MDVGETNKQARRQRIPAVDRLRESPDATHRGLRGLRHHAPRVNRGIRGRGTSSEKERFGPTLVALARKER
jgi:hypothetical protein